ncbi:hypothetical protein BH20ACT24_BH20ACT24_08420 [soil metagenome]
MERMKRYALGIAWVVIGVAFSVSLTFGAYTLGNDASGAPTLSREIQAVARPKQQVVRTSPASGGGTPIAQPGLPATPGSPASPQEGSEVDPQDDPVNVSGSSNSRPGSSNSGPGSSNSGQSENSGSDDDDDDRDNSGSGGGDD